MFPHRCTIKRPWSSTATGVDAATETVGEPEEIASDVRCYFEDRRTSFIREDSGDRATNPARVFFPNSQNIQEGDLVEFEHVVAMPGYGTDYGSSYGTELKLVAFEVRGVNAPNVTSPVDHTEAELERST